MREKREEVAGTSARASLDVRTLETVAEMLNTEMEGWKALRAANRDDEHALGGEYAVLAVSAQVREMIEAATVTRSTVSTDKPTFPQGLPTVSFGLGFWYLTPYGEVDCVQIVQTCARRLWLTGEAIFGRDGTEQMQRLDAQESGEVAP